MPANNIRYGSVVRGRWWADGRAAGSRCPRCVESPDGQASGVFPSAGTANPTLTIAALSLRAAGPVMATLTA
jgi:hypothetical protein